jgi:hypothetical protein
MPWNPAIPPEVRTVHLGQFTPVHARAIVAACEEAGIAWWTKEPGFLSRFWQLGIEVFVDRDRLDEAKAIAERIGAAP